LEKLWKQGKIGLEFSVEFDASVLIGVYPMNPAKENGSGPGEPPPPMLGQEPLTAAQNQ
jgi:hypothetical protein